MQIYQGGITIHSAMDRRIQNIADSIYTSDEYRPEDREILSGFYMMDYSGRVLATVGSFEKKEGNRLFSNAIDAGRQSGSVIKPVSIYAPAIDNGMINFSTILKDEPLPHYFPDGSAGPGNAGGTYTKKMTTADAITVSQNAPAAQLCNTMTPLSSYTFLTEKLNFTHLDPTEDSSSIAAMALGGVHGGITVEEMTAAFQIFGNGGVYHKPYMRCV